MDLQFVPLSGESPRPDASTLKTIKAHVMRRYRHNQRQLRLQKKIQTRGSALNCYTEQLVSPHSTTSGCRSTPTETLSSHAPANGLLDFVTLHEEAEFPMDRCERLDQLILPHPSASVSLSHFDPFDTLPLAMTPRLSTLLRLSKWHFWHWHWH